MSTNNESEDVDSVCKLIDKNTIHESDIIDSQDINEAELDAMKGDSIGDTVYSAKWIINTLRSLCKVDEIGWSEGLETDLCMLWDMSAEKEIVDFLVENGFLSIAELTLKISKEPRLIEIILGIIGNMCCHTHVLETLGNNNGLTTTILGLLLSTDTETLVQILRLLQSAVWNVREDSKSTWLKIIEECEFLSEVMVFILNSSTNNDLLISTIDVLHTMANIKVLNDVNLLQKMFKMEDLVPALLEAFVQVIPVQKDDHSERDLKVIENWLLTITSLIQTEPIKFGDCITEEQFVIILNILLRILQPYKHTHNLVPMDERSASCIHQCIEMMLWFEYNGLCIAPEINSIILSIPHKFGSVTKEPFERDNLDETMDELIKYVERYWIKMFDLLSSVRILEILQMCKIEIAEMLIEIVKVNSDIPDDKREKLTEIQTSLDFT